MSRKTKPQRHKAHRPMPYLLNPLASLQPAPKAQRDAVMLRFLTALECMARGEHPGPEEWSHLSDAINTVETLATTMRRLDPADVMPLVNAAIAAMVGAANRYKAGHGMRVDGPGLQALRDVVSVYEQCTEILSERDMSAAQKATEKRVRELLRQRDPSHEVVML